MPTTIPLVIACGNDVLHLVKDLIDGTVRVENCSFELATLAPGDMFSRAFEDPAINVAELSLSNYLTRRAQGTCPYVAIPVYLSRSFPQANMYVRTDRNILKPQDLRGRRVGLGEYENTVCVWDRGILQNEYGVLPSEIKWVSITKGSTNPEKSSYQPSPGVTVERLHTTKTPSDMLESGEIDALVAPRPPACFTKGAANVGRLFAQPEAVEDDYFRRTGAFPILHIVGVRTELVERHPGLAQNLFRAFLAAKDRVLASKIKAAALPSASPELISEVGRMTALMGNDFYSYGLNERDRGTLDLFMRYYYEQGFSDRRYDIAELFSPVPVSQYSA